MIWWNHICRNFQAAENYRLHGKAGCYFFFQFISFNLKYRQIVYYLSDLTINLEKSNEKSNENLMEVVVATIVFDTVLHHSFNKTADL